MSDDGPPPTSRESFNEQDPADSMAVKAVQVRPSRSIPKALTVLPAGRAEVHSLIETEHYLKSMPAAARLCFGVYLEGVLVGAAVFTSGSRHGYRMLAAARPQEVATLARLWLHDDLPRNSESRVLGIVLRYLKRNTDWKLILSYADPTVGHVGIVYQASGWLYLGEGEGGTYLRMPDGQLHHPRSVYDQYGTNRVAHLRATGINASRVPVPGKHRYVYVLDPAWRWRLVAEALPFPHPHNRGPPP